MELSDINGNISKATALLTMESLNIPPLGIYPVFVLGTVVYCFILFCNGMLLITIALHGSLHKPMHILLFNLPINDLLGASAFFPQFISSVLAQRRSISYPACFVQGMLIHVYGVGSLLILTVMAYDRYVAICSPLRYNAIMTNGNLAKTIALIWVADLSVIGVLFFLLTRFEICRTFIVDMTCNNPTLMKLICDDTRVNNIYGLFLTLLAQGGSLLVITFTYIKILLACLLNKQPDARSKAIQTCATHLVVFLFLEFNAFFTIIAHRLNSVSPYLRRSFGVSVLIFPPLLNPLIYGLKTKEIRDKIKFFNKQVSNF